MGCLTSKESSTGKQTRSNSRPKITQGIRELRKQYDVQREALGAGSYGQVYKATNKKDREHIVAIKVIEKSGLSADEIEDLMNEVAIL